MAARKRPGGHMLDAATTTGWVPCLGAGTTQVAPSPLRPKGCRGAAASAVLALLDDVQRHRRRRAALHTRPRRRQRGPWGAFGILLSPSGQSACLSFSVLPDPSFMRRRRRAYCFVGLRGPGRSPYIPVRVGPGPLALRVLRGRAPGGLSARCSQGRDVFEAARQGVPGARREGPTKKAPGPGATRRDAAPGARCCVAARRRCAQGICLLAASCIASPGAGVAPEIPPGARPLTQRRRDAPFVASLRKGPAFPPNASTL